MIDSASTDVYKPELEGLERLVSIQVGDVVVRKYFLITREMLKHADLETIKKHIKRSVFEVTEQMFKNIDEQKEI